MTSTDIVPFTRTTCTDIEVAQPQKRPRISPVLIAMCAVESVAVIVALIYTAMGGFK